MPYTCWVSTTEALDFAGSESDFHPWLCCAIAGRQKDADMTKILKRIWKRFGNERLPNNTARPWMPVYNIYSIHELYSTSSTIFGRGEINFNRHPNPAATKESALTAPSASLTIRGLNPTRRQTFKSQSPSFGYIRFSPKDATIFSWARH
jgi:hypothetical protein